MTVEASGDEWVLCPWFEEHGVGAVHPDDVGAVREVSPYGKVLRVAGAAGEYRVLSYGERRFRVKPHLLRVIEKPAFWLGQRVRVVGKEGEGVVVDVLWHHQREEPFFLLSFGGKKKTRRYWASDLR